MWFWFEAFKKFCTMKVKVIFCTMIDNFNQCVEYQNHTLRRRKKKAVRFPMPVSEWAAFQDPQHRLQSYSQLTIRKLYCTNCPSYAGLQMVH